MKLNKSRYQAVQVGVFNPFTACSCKEKTMKNHIKQGVVLFRENDKNYPVSKVHISNLTQKGQGTTTDEKGRYALSGNPSDLIRFSHVGLKTKEMLFRDIPEVLMLENQVEELGEVVVEAPKVNVTPSNNSKLKKAGSWLFWGIVLTAGTLLFVKTDDKKEK